MFCKLYLELYWWKFKSCHNRDLKHYIFVGVQSCNNTRTIPTQTDICLLDPLPESSPQPTPSLTPIHEEDEPDLSDGESEECDDDRDGDYEPDEDSEDEDISSDDDDDDADNDRYL